MKKIIIILTKDITNESVRLIAQNVLAIKDGCLVQTLTLNKTKIDTVNQRIIYENPPFRRTILFSDIACVIKRTWGPERTEALEKCQKLEDAGVKIINGCNLIDWMHDKIKQYETLKDSNLFPQSICFDETWMKQKTLHDINDIISIANKALVYPMVFKTAQGCKTDGVFRADNEDALIALLTDRLNAPQNTPIANIHRGFLLQQYISPTMTSDTISTYYRINIVNNKPQSAVQFQLEWINNTKELYYRLSENMPDADDKPVDLSIFPEEALNQLIQAAPSTLEVIGIDVMLDRQGRLFLLEYNDGPLVSGVVELGKKFSQSATNAAAAACERFAQDIVVYCATPDLSLSATKRQIRANL